MGNYVVIGGTKGFGDETVKILAADGHHVKALARDVKSKELENVEYFEVDVTQKSPDWPELDKLDGLVYCPGSMRLKPFISLKTEDFQEDFEINFLGAVKAIKNYLPVLKKGKSPSIILFSTVAVQSGLAYHASVSASKGAIEGFVRAMAAELVPTVRVNCIAPSLSDTHLAKNILASEDKREAAQKRNPMRQIGKPEDIASLASFLLSDNASWITGQVLHIDGGLSVIHQLS